MRGSPVETQKTNTVPNFEVALVIIATFFVSVFLSAAVQLTVGSEIALIVGELVILAVPLTYLLMKRIDIKSYARINVNPKLLAIGLGCGLLLLMIDIASTNVLTAIFGESTTVQQSNELLVGLSTTPTGLIAVALSLGLAGVCEEFAFRGFLQNSLFKNLSGKNSRYTFAIAVTISAVIFGLFHFDPEGVYTIAAFISGLALGYIYHRWGYVASATAHGSMNLIVLALLVLNL
jgi:membrane protease YdiL (CAAX protease family)